MFNNLSYYEQTGSYHYVYVNIFMFRFVWGAVNEKNIIIERNEDVTKKKNDESLIHVDSLDKLINYLNKKLDKN